MDRLRKGRENTGRGAANFLRETVSRVRDAGATGPLTCGPTAASTPAPSSPPAAIRASASPSRSASTKVCGTLSRLFPRQTGPPYPTGWRAPPTWPRRNTHPSRASLTPCRYVSSSGGSGPRPALNRRCLPPTAITPSSPIETATPWLRRPTIAATPRSRTPSAT